MHIHTHGLFALAFMILLSCGDDDDNKFKPTIASTNNTPMVPKLETCTSNDNPQNVSPPETDTEIKDFRFELKDQTIHTIEGTVISDVKIAKPKVIDRAIFLATGAYLDKGCSTTQNGTSYRWEGVACQASEGTIYNIFTLEHDAFVGASEQVSKGDKVRISGYEIEKFNDFSAGGGFWNDGSDNNGTGQVSLWLTNVCLVK